jgi:hypothetical protein
VRTHSNAASALVVRRLLARFAALTLAAALPAAWAVREREALRGRGKFASGLRHRRRRLSQRRRPPRLVHPLAQECRRWLLHHLLSLQSHLG